MGHNFKYLIGLTFPLKPEGEDAEKEIRGLEAIAGRAAPLIKHRKVMKLYGEQER